MTRWIQSIAENKKGTHDQVVSACYYYCAPVEHHIVVKKRCELPPCGGRILRQAQNKFEPRLKTSGISLSLNLQLGLRIRSAGILKSKKFVISTGWFCTTFSTNFCFHLEMFDLDGHNLGTTQLIIVPFPHTLHFAIADTESLKIWFTNEQPAFKKTCHG